MHLPFSRSLLLRANRALGVALVEAELISPPQQHEASQTMASHLQAERWREAGLLRILCYDLQTLDESRLLAYQHEIYGLSLLDLSTYNVAKSFDEAWDINACWATWSLPFDTLDGFTCVATAYYLSEPVRKCWEEQLGTPICWYGATCQALEESLDALEAAAQAAAET